VVFYVQSTLLSDGSAALQCRDEGSTLMITVGGHSFNMWLLVLTWLRFQG